MLALLLAGAARAACAAAADTADGLYEEGVAMQEKGDFAAAVDRFSRALILRPSDRRIQDHLSAAGRRVVEQDDQLKNMSLADLSALVQQAQRILEDRRRRMAEALERLKLAETESQLSEPAALLRSCRGVDILVEVALGDDDESRRIKDYLHSLCGNLESSLHDGVIADAADAQRVAGYIAFCRSDWGAAVEAWRSALAAAPDDAHLKDLLARAEENDARAREIAETGRQMLEAESLAKTGDPARAAALLETILRRDPTDRNAIHLLEDCRQKIQVEAREAAVRGHRSRAEASERAGRPLEAAQAWIALLELDPLDEDALAHLKRTRNALAREAAATPASSSRDEDLSRRLYTLGLIDYADGRLKDAADRFAASVAADASNDFARRALERVRREMAP